MDKDSQLQKLKEKMLKDDQLPLKKGATNLVFGDGDADSEIMFIGEGPGYWEDQKGIPFVGNAGAFLNYLLAQIGIERKNVFITNVIHYRPPENRDPEEKELLAFRSYLDEMIEIISPKAIVTLGRFSMAKFLPGASISSVHGKPTKVSWKGREILIIPMYHPAAGLRSSAIKQATINDFIKIPDIIKKIDKIKINREDKVSNDENDKEGEGLEQMNLL